jgi:hypothetical protein
MGAILPQGKTQFFDSVANGGAPLAGGKVSFFARGTTTFQNTFQDINLSILNANPVVLDANGEALIWGSGAYTMLVQDANGNQVYQADTQAPISTVLSETLLTDNGAVNAIVVGITPAPASLAALTGIALKVKVAVTNTGATTINPNGLGAVAIQQGGVALSGGELVAGSVATLVYDGTLFECIGKGAGAVNVGAATAGTQAPQSQQTIGGAGTSYVNQTANRTLNTTFTNSTGGPIFVISQVTFSASDEAAGPLVNGVQLSLVSNGGLAMAVSISFVVPNGDTYEIGSSGAGSLTSWFELGM